MKRSITLFLFLVVGYCLSGQKLISIDSIPNNLGQHVMICEKVVDAFKPNGENKNTYLNFGGMYPNNTFTVIIFSKDLPNFPFNPMDEYKNKNICVQGIISFYKGKPQIVVRNPEQIDVVFGEQEEIGQ